MGLVVGLEPSLRNARESGSAAATIARTSAASAYPGSINLRECYFSVVATRPRRLRSFPSPRLRMCGPLDYRCLTTAYLA